MKLGESMKRFLYVLIPLLLTCEYLHSKNPHPLSFYPYKTGNVWQYRDFYTGEIARTRYLVSDSTDSYGNIHLVIKDVGPTGYTALIHQRIDTGFCVYGEYIFPEYPRYKLGAQVGEEWFAGYDFLLNIEYRISVVNIGVSYVLGVPTLVKTFRFCRILSWGQEICDGDEHLASGFGLVQSHFYYYLSGAIIDSVKYGEIVAVSEENQPVPQEFKLYQNYPNPFNSSTIIQYCVPFQEWISIRLYNILGQQVRVLVDRLHYHGEYTITLNSNDLPSGIYFYQMKTSKKILVRKLTIIK